MDFSLLNNDGISPTVGVILMVAITVVLAVTVGAMVLDIGSSTSQNSNAGVTLEETSNGVEVKVNSFGGNTDNLEVLVDGTVKQNITSVGTYSVTASSGSVVSVRGTTDSGESSVVQSITTETNTVHPASFDVSTDSNSSVTAGETFTVNYTVKNTGEQTSTQPITLVVDGTTKNSEKVELAGGESSSGTLALSTESIDTGSSIPYEVTSNTSTASNTVTVVGPKGTEENPIEISNVTELQAVNENTSAHYVLVNNIDASKTSSWNDDNGFKPINSFSGSLDGNGYEIQDLKINRDSSDKVGLIGAMSGGSVSNIDVVNADITGNRDVGGLVGNNSGSGSSVSNIGVVNADITGNRDVGGLVGNNSGSGSSVSGSYATGSVTGSGEDVENVGGLVGDNDGGSVSESYATGSVDGGSGKDVGGLVGDNDGGRVSESYATGKVTGSNRVGGLVGQNPGTVSESYATGSVDGGGGMNVGGLVGTNSDTVTNSYATGKVTGTGHLLNFGGLVGNNYGSVSGSYWDTETTGQSSSDWGTGLTTSEMQGSGASDSGNMSAFDFDTVWTTVEGDYPELQQNESS